MILVWWGPKLTVQGPLAARRGGDLGEGGWPVIETAWMGGPVWTTPRTLFRMSLFFFSVCLNRSNSVCIELNCFHLPFRKSAFLPRRVDLAHR